MLFGPGPPDLVLARKHVEDAIAQHLGPLTLVIPKLDPESAANLLGNRDRTEGLALLLDLQASIEEADQHPVEAGALRERAAALRARVGSLPA
jgi:hypothetical protein